MQPSPQAQAFVHSATVARSVDDLVQALKPALEHEADLRKTFSAQRHNVASLDPHAGLVDIFAPGAEALRRTHARLPADEKELSAKYVMPLKDDARRKTGEPAMVDSLDQFRNVWSVFSEGTLAQLGSGPWENVIVAGGSILAALLPLPARVTKQNSKRALRKWFHEDGMRVVLSSSLYLFLPASHLGDERRRYFPLRPQRTRRSTSLRSGHSVDAESNCLGRKEVRSDL